MLNNLELAKLASNVGLPTSHSYLEIGESSYHKPVLARVNYNYTGSKTPASDIIKELEEMPVASVVIHKFKGFNEDRGTKYRKITQSHWVAV